MKKLALLALVLLSACTRPPIPQDSKKLSGAQVNVHTSLNLQGTTKDKLTISARKFVFYKAELSGIVRTSDLAKKEIARFKCTVDMQKIDKDNRWLGQAAIPFQNNLPKGKYVLYLTLAYDKGVMHFKIPYWVGYSSLF